MVLVEYSADSALFRHLPVSFIPANSRPINPVDVVTTTPMCVVVPVSTMKVIIPVVRSLRAFGGELLPYCSELAVPQIEVPFGRLFLARKKRVAADCLLTTFYQLTLLFGCRLCRCLAFFFLFLLLLEEDY